MPFRHGIALLALIAACGWPVSVALGQAAPDEYVAHVQNATDGANNEGSRSTSPAVGVSNLGVVAAGTRYLSLFSKAMSITPLDERVVDDPDFPFELTQTSGTTLLDPRAYHDPIHNRLWVLYNEAEGDRKINHCASLAMLHLSVNMSGANFGASDPLDGTQWWYYTGSGGSAGSGGEAFNLRSTLIEPYKTLGAHQPVEFTARMSSMGFHTISGEADDRSGALIVATNSVPENCSVGGDGSPPLFPVLRQFVYIIPYEHDGGTASILDGDRPSESDMTVVRPYVDSTPPLLEDESIFGFVVQAPFEQVENATFIISVPETIWSVTGPFEKIRLKGLFYDDSQPTGEEWTLQQRTNSTGTALLDNTVDGSLQYWQTNFEGGFPVTRPRTPDTSWGPLAQGTYFHSAVLAKDTSGEFRIFAVHAVLPVDDTGSWFEEQWVVQWYVIDPKLADFHASTAGTWQPSIVAEGRIPGNIEKDEGDRYHPVIVVNRQGQAFIEYTYSDGTTWPQIRRVRLNSNYTDIVGGVETVVRTGPPQPYDEQYLLTWANIADAQADPANGCAYWSTHTLVTDDTSNPTTKRDAWLFHQAYTNSVGPLCLGTLSMLDLNDDGVVDALDLAALTDLYARSARRIDLNADGVTDRHDLDLYMAAYEEYTRR